MFRFITATDGTAVNVAHIAVIFVAESRHPEGWVVRCRLALAKTEYSTASDVLNLSPVLADKEHAELWIKTVLGALNQDAPDAGA